MCNIRIGKHVFDYFQTGMIPSTNWLRYLMIHACPILSLFFKESAHQLYSFILIIISETSRIRRFIPTNIKKQFLTISSIKTKKLYYEVSYSFHKLVTIYWVRTVCLELL